MLAGSSIRDLDDRIEASLIGRNVAIGRGPALPKAYRFVVGDNAEIADPVRVLVTGAGGMLGQDVVRAPAATRASRSRARSST